MPDFTPLPQQQLAIQAPLGPVLVVAGPGAGKTYCLTARIEHLIRVHGIDPRRICAVTFTNKAAEEIAVRLRHSLGTRADEITRGTIHALCLAILREHAGVAGLKKGFGVADEDYQKIILGRLRVHPDGRSALLGCFGRHRLLEEPLSPRDAQLYREYAAHLERRNMLDFDDLIVRTAALLKQHGELADAIAARWDYLLVDEFQDLNALQYQVLKRFAEPHHNYFAVGDDEQSIFSWTGADPYALVRFKRDYGIEQPIVLDKNCRCSRAIFETARRVLAQNPTLFDKQLSAERESEYEVRACGFADEEAEAAWLIDDIVADAQAAGLKWGDYALLYRRHSVGRYLEGRLLRAGIPCRLARGRSLIEDDVIRYVIAALRIVRDPDDPVALEAFARCMLSEHFFQEVVASAPFADNASSHNASPDNAPSHNDFIQSLRILARARPSHDPDTKRLWRLVYQVENLRALTRSLGSVPALVDEILSQSVGPYRNKLEECHDELTDPAAMPEAVRLAERLEDAIAANRPVGVEAQGGLEIALRGMLTAAGVRRVPDQAPASLKPRGIAPSSPPDPLSTNAERGNVVIGPGDAGELGLAVTLFKALQLMHSRELDKPLKSYVAFDFETTDKDIATCGVVEIGAVRMVNGAIADRFHTLVNPYQPIAPAATQVHGYTDADVQGARSFTEIWPEFRAFVGDDMLVAHNGQHFDIPLLRRLAAGQDGVDTLVFYDTLPLVRSLSRDSAKLADIATRFGIEAGRTHHALDDAETLARVYRALEAQRVIRARKAVLVNVLDYLGLGLALEIMGGGTGEEGRGETALLFAIARFATLGRYSEALEFYATERERLGDSAPSVDDVIERLGGRTLMTRLRAEPDPAQRYPAAVARLNALMDGPGEGTLEEAIDALLERVALSTSEGVAVAPNRVNLLTLHSTKGLEFSRVYVVGVEDYQLPGYQAVTNERQDEIEEARRLLYVGMTRACDRLILTRVDQRFGQMAGGSGFLDEMGLETEALSTGA